MGAGSYVRKQFAGGAPATTLNGAINDAVTALVVGAATGWPDATVGPFVIVVDRGLATEEKMLVAARTGTSLSTITRAYDDTLAFAHSNGAAVEHVLDASTIDQVNRLANLLTTKGDTYAHNGTNPTRVAGAADDGTDDGFVLEVDSTQAGNVRFKRHQTLVIDASAPDVDGYRRIWYDTTFNMLRSSDGVDWALPANVYGPFADAAARNTALGGDPVGGTCAVVGTGAGLVLQIYDGTVWTDIARRDEGIPRFADTTARDAYFAAPTNGVHAYVTGTKTLYEYRGAEWIVVNQKVTIADVQPDEPNTGDLWLQPV